MAPVGPRRKTMRTRIASRTRGRLGDLAPRDGLAVARDLGRAGDGRLDDVALDEAAGRGVQLEHAGAARDAAEVARRCRSGGGEAAVADADRRAWRGRCAAHTSPRPPPRAPAVEAHCDGQLRCRRARRSGSSSRCARGNWILPLSRTPARGSTGSAARRGRRRRGRTATARTAVRREAIMSNVPELARLRTRCIADTLATRLGRRASRLAPMGRTARRTEASECRQCLTYCDRVIAPATCVAARCPRCTSTTTRSAASATWAARRRCSRPRSTSSSSRRPSAARATGRSSWRASRSRAARSASRRRTSAPGEEWVCRNRRFADFPDTGPGAIRAFDLRHGLDAA